MGKDRIALRQIRTLFSVGAIGELTDGQLLERFATDQGEAAELAFAVLVERHGPMVLRVCQGVLVDPNDMQDAFQATFLVLVKQAGALWVQDSLGPWLHQVAYRTAACARSTAARRRRHEQRAALLRKEGRVEAGGELGRERELERVIHEELGRLPGHFRAPVVLCDLEGRTQEQAARSLGWPIGTVKSRLSRARERLRNRLSRRGFAPNAMLLASALKPDLPSAPVPPALVDSTARAAVQFAAVRAVVQGSAASLAQGVLRSMSMTRWLKAGSVLLAMGATVSGVSLLAQSGTSGPEPPRAELQAARADDLPTFTVKPGKLIVTEVTRGNLEAAHRADVFSQVEGRTTIVRLLPEGTRVKKGQLVCELDSAALKDSLINQKITTRGAEIAYQSARLAREAADIAVDEYVEGTFRQEQGTLRAEAAAAQSAIEKADARMERARRARKRVSDLLASRGDAVTPADLVAELDIEDRLEAAEQSLLREKLALELARTRQQVLQKYTREKVVRELKTDVERKRKDELARQAAWELEKNKEAHLEKQIESCQIYAPNDGILVYAGGSVAGQPMIEEGAAVRERQMILSVPDISQMQVNAKVREATVDQILPGMKVKVRVDAFPDSMLTGEVASVAPLPDPSNLFRSAIKVYTTLVKLDQSLPGLRPGMTAEVEILIKDHDNVLSVPVEALVESENRRPRAARKRGPRGQPGWRVAVKTPSGGFAWRDVVLGPSNDKFVEIVEGLQDGDVVITKPQALMSGDKKGQQPDAPASTPDGPAARPAPR